MTFELLLLFAVLFYIIQTGVFILGIEKPSRPTGRGGDLFVSVVIAARNEERNLQECVRSVLRQTYSGDRFECIIVDDHSTDSTRQLCEEFASQYPQVRTFTASPDPVLRGKTNALAQAIDRARGELIMITDADCTVPETWIEETVKYYETDLGIMGGITLLHSQSHFHGMQSLDWAYLLGVAAAAVRLKHPLSIIGNNLSFRKKAYASVGGYRTIPFSVTEDYMLFQAIIGSGDWQYEYPVNPGLLVTSKPCETWKELVRQKHRWGKGGLDMRLIGFLMMAVSYLLHGSILIGLAGLSFLSASTAFLIKMCADYLFLYRILIKLQRVELLRYFFSFQLYYSLYVLLLPFLVFFGGKVIWKGREY